MKEVGGKTGVLVGLDLPSASAGTEAGVQSPHWGNWVRGETFEAESQTADLWQLKWYKNQRVLAAAIYTPNRDAGPLGGAATGSCSLGIVEQFQGEGRCWLQRDRWRGCEGGDCGGKCLWKKAGQPWKQGNSAELCIGSGAITIASLPTRQQLNNGEADPWNAWCTELQSRTPAGVGGGPLCLTPPKNREGSQAREPSKCLKEQSYGERLAKEAFWSPATRG